MTCSPGEVVWIDEDGLHAAQAVPAGRNALCIFEHVYFARPDSRVGGVEVHGSRVRMGERLAQRGSGRGRPRHRRRRRRHPCGDRLLEGLRDPVQRGADQEPLRRPHLHPARAGHARAGHPHEVQPARRGRGKAHRRRRRLDRPREHDAPARPDALRRGRGRGARPHLVAARRLALLLRDRHGRRGPARGRAPLGRGDARATSARPRCTTSRSRACRRRPSCRRTRSAAPASRGSTRRACRRSPRSSASSRRRRKRPRTFRSSATPEERARPRA